MILQIPAGVGGRQSRHDGVDKTSAKDSAVQEEPDGEGGVGQGQGGHWNRWGSGSHLISSQQPYRDHGRAFPWRLSLQEGDSWISLGLVSPAPDSNTNEGGRKLSFRLFLPCGPSTRLGTFELIHPRAWGSADLCCVHLLDTAQGCSLLHESSHSHMDTPWWQDHLPHQTRRSQRTDGRRECWVEGSSVRGASSQTPEPSPHGASLGLQVSRTINVHPGLKEAVGKGLFWELGATLPGCCLCLCPLS